jgi:CheY-like chemotaxis protein
MRVVRSIVLVDDDMDDQEIFKTACASVDDSVVVIAFDSGEHAISSLVKLFPPADLIFLDLNMPRLNGIEVLKEIRRTDSIKSVPVIVYTTSFDEKVKETCEKLGAIDIIEKPNSFDSLCEKLESILHSFA